MLFSTMSDNLRNNPPLVHNATNYVPVNDCSNPKQLLEASAASVVLMGVAGQVAHKQGLKINRGIQV